LNCLFRWGALIAGIWWGGKRYAALKAQEDEVKMVYMDANLYETLILFLKKVLFKIQ
jgi:hypothetical protein